MRWTPKFKANLMALLSDGRIGRDHIKTKFQLSEEELQEWERRYQDGKKGLRVSNQQTYRDRA